MNYHQAPRNARYAAPRPASEKQLALVAKLAGELHGAGVDAYLGDPEVVRALETAAGASELITGLIAASKVKRADKAERAPKAAEGYYVRPADGAAIVVVKSKNADRTYGKRLVFPVAGGRPSWVYEPGLGISVAELEPMTAEAAAKIGLSHGYCVKCCAELGGKTLSAAVSALVGYGERCAAKLGWSYPHGVVAQRAYLAEHGK